MNANLVTRLGAAALTLGLAAAPAALAQAPKAAPPTIQGLWSSGGSTIRVAVSGAQARATFVQVGQGAQALGFKPEEQSFVATVDGNYLFGEQTSRYAGQKCHPSGRKVPMMGRMSLDGQFLAIHFYNVQVDPNCRDTGRYVVSQTIWQRVAAQR